MVKASKASGLKLRSQERSVTTKPMCRVCLLSHSKSAVPPLPSLLGLLGQVHQHKREAQDSPLRIYLQNSFTVGMPTCLPGSWEGPCPQEVRILQTVMPGAFCQDVESFLSTPLSWQLSQPSHQSSNYVSPRYQDPLGPAEEHRRPPRPQHPQMYKVRPGTAGLQLFRLNVQYEQQGPTLPPQEPGKEPAWLRLFAMLASHVGTG